MNAVTLLAFLTVCMMMSQYFVTSKSVSSKAVNFGTEVANSAPGTNMISWNPTKFDVKSGGDSFRKSIVHLPPTKTVTSQAQRHRPHPCQFKRCYVGQKCVVDGITGRGVCVCKRHCHHVEKPLCGTDGEYYMNRCEMHKAACLNGIDIYNAKHKDCFYKETLCSPDQATEFQNALLQFHQRVDDTSQRDEVIHTKLDNVSLTVNNSGVDGIAMTPSTKQSTSDSVWRADVLKLYDDVLTNDNRGDAIKLLFHYLDLDADGAVGSEELYEVSLIEGLHEILPPPCSLFHLLHFSDRNHDNALDMLEMLETYNIAILRLPEDKQYIQQVAHYGSSVTLTCAIEGENSPLWRRGSMEVPKHDPEIQVNDNQITLLVAHPKWAGNFSCHAHTHPNLHQTIELSIVVAPKVEIFPANQQVTIGSSVTIGCHALALPPPLVTWLKNGEVLNDDRFIMLENNTELHLNSALATDSAAYSCLATNDAGTSEEMAAIMVDDVANESVGKNRNGAYFVFHQRGVMIVEPSTCNIFRTIPADKTVPGLLRQDKLCKAPPGGENHSCKWSQAVAVGTRFVYAAQPNENRMVVLDVLLQRVVEVLATNPIPTSLTYVKSTDQLFVLCWVDPSRERSSLLVVHAAGIPGPHMAVQIQPLDGGNTVDYSVFQFYVPPEGLMNGKSLHGFVSHRDQQVVFKINLETLLYEEDIIDLQAQDCIPADFKFQSIGGVLSVTCSGNPGRKVRVEIATGRVIDVVRADHEFISSDSRHVIRYHNATNDVTFNEVTGSGSERLLMSFSISFKISDATFAAKLTYPSVAIAYVSTSQGDVLSMDPETKSLQVVDGIPRLINQSEVVENTRYRLLVPSAWFDRHLATSTENRFDVININNNQVTCSINDVTNIDEIVWAYK